MAEIDERVAGLESVLLDTQRNLGIVRIEVGLLRAQWHLGERHRDTTNAEVRQCLLACMNHIKDSSAVVENQILTAPDPAKLANEWWRDVTNHMADEGFPLVQ